MYHADTEHSVEVKSQELVLQMLFNEQQAQRACSFDDPIMKQSGEPS